MKKNGSKVSAVDHPPHYTSHPAKCAKCGHGIECIQVAEHLNFCLGNAMKYIWRADLKSGIEDLEKAKWYVTREIERRTKEKRAIRKLVSAISASEKQTNPS